MLIEKDISIHHSTDTLAEIALMSRSKLIQLFRFHFGVALFEYLQVCRLAEAKKMLEDESVSIKVIARKCGYRHACNFSTAFKKRYGMKPKEMRNSR